MIISTTQHKNGHMTRIFKTSHNGYYVQHGPVFENRLNPLAEDSTTRFVPYESARYDTLRQARNAANKYTKKYSIQER